MLAKLRVRAADAVRAWLRGPSRIDPAATVSATAEITASEISGPAVIGDHVRLHEVVLGGRVSVGPSSSLWGPGIYVLAKDDPIEIGNFCSIARDVSVHGYSHDPERVSTHYIGRNVLGRPIEEEVLSKGPTRIGHDVWIGAGAHVMGGVSIGTGAIIGAGSVVTRDVPPYAVAVGVPATVIRRRFDDAVIERLLESRWWEWSREEIRAKGGLFTSAVSPALLDEYL